MNKKQFKDAVATMTDDLYDKGYKDGVKSSLNLQLITLEDETGKITLAFRLGLAEFAKIVEIPQGMIDRIKEGGL